MLQCLAWLLVLAFSWSAVLAQETAAPANQGWGGVSGRVVFEGDLNDPALKSYREDLKLYAPIRIQKNLRGITPRVTGTVPNHALPIDPRTLGVKNAFVYLRKKPARIHPAPTDRVQKPIEVVCHDHIFSPRELIVDVGQKVRMLSPDGPANFYNDTVMNEPFNRLVTPDKPAEWTPQKREPFPLRLLSNFQPAAASYWLVVDHPYAVMTAADGSFKLENLPVGDHELTIWQEVVGYVEKKLPITIRDDEVRELPPAKITVEQLTRPRRSAAP